MREVQPVTALSSVTSPPRVRPWIRAVAIGSVVLGLASGVVDERTLYITSPFVMSILLMVSGTLAVSQDHSTRNGWRRFLMLNSALWATYAITYSVAVSDYGVGEWGIAILIRTVTFGWGLSTLFGGVVAMIRHRRSANEEAGTSDGPPPLKRRIAEKLKTWIDIWARRTTVQLINRDRAAHATPAH
jgi:hypothetical protein